MARKAIVNKDIILSMLLKGETTQSIAEKFRVSRQAIDLYRRDFIEKGVLPNQRAARTRKEPKRVTPQGQKNLSHGQFLPIKVKVSRERVSLDEHINLIRDFIEKGVLPNQRATRTSTEPKEATPQRQKIMSPGQLPPIKDKVSLDEHIDLIIDALKALKRLPRLEKEVEIYKKEYENALLKIEYLKENERKRDEQESRWLLTKRYDESNLT